VFALAGELTGWLLAAAALLSIAVTLCLAELAGLFEAPGGPAEYCRAAFGDAVGFAAG
jgi:amino acid transporter